MLAVMRCLRAWLRRDTWDGIVDECPFELRATLRSPAEPPVKPIVDRRDLVEEVARSVQHPADRAELEVRAAFAILKQALPRGLADAIPEELPPGAAEMWRSSR